MKEFPSTAITALVGQAVSDAYGAPFEYHNDASDYAELSMREKRYLNVREDIEGGRWHPGRDPGVYTDDTQQALALLRAWHLTATDRDPSRADPLDGGWVALRFRSTLRQMAMVSGYRFGVHRGTGRNFRQAIRSGPVDTAGLGAAMRIGPAATLIKDSELIAPWVIHVSSTTTNNPVALGCAVIFSYACWQAANPGRTVPSLAAQVDGIPSNIWEVCVEAVVRMNALGEGGLLEFARETELSNKPLDCAANGFALTGVPWVIYHAMKAKTFEEALLGVCSSGGDTDTVAAMAGCLAALRLGRRSIPMWMLEQLRGREHLFDPTIWHPIASEKALMG